MRVVRLERSHQPLERLALIVKGPEIPTLSTLGPTAGAGKAGRTVAGRRIGIAPGEQPPGGALVPHSLAQHHAPAPAVQPPPPRPPPLGRHASTTGRSSARAVSHALAKLLAPSRARSRSADRPLMPTRRAASAVDSPRPPPARSPAGAQPSSRRRGRGAPPGGTAHARDGSRSSAPTLGSRSGSICSVELAFARAVQWTREA